MTTREALDEAIHEVYCGMMADHDQPNDKDRDQARQLIAAIGRSVGSGSGAAAPEG